MAVSTSLTRTRSLDFARLISTATMLSNLTRKMWTPTWMWDFYSCFKLSIWLLCSLARTTRKNWISTPPFTGWTRRWALHPIITQLRPILPRPCHGTWSFRQENSPCFIHSMLQKRYGRWSCSPDERSNCSRLSLFGQTSFLFFAQFLFIQTRIQFTFTLSVFMWRRCTERAKMASSTSRKEPNCRFGPESTQ